MVKVGIGQDSHRFEKEPSDKPLMLGGVMIPGYPGLEGNSDADVILHALTNAISGISCVNILGTVSDELCLTQGITDSAVYVGKAIQTLTTGGYRIRHVSIAIEGKRPHCAPYIEMIRSSIARLLVIRESDVGITATTGEGMTPFGCGTGMQVFVVVTAESITP